MRRNLRIYFRDIFEAISRIEEYTRDLSFENFAESRLVRDAVIRNLEIVGEADKNIPAEVKEKHWR